VQRGASSLERLKPALTRQAAVNDSDASILSTR
jgi:hypothetical protein